MRDMTMPKLDQMIYSKTDASTVIGDHGVDAAVIDRAIDQHKR